MNRRNLIKLASAAPVIAYLPEPGPGDTEEASKTWATTDQPWLMRLEPSGGGYEVWAYKTVIH